jgi:phospholipid/cholesterol/gamma-HCH transport system substrate-binding protein
MRIPRSRPAMGAVTRPVMGAVKAIRHAMKPARAAILVSVAATLAVAAAGCSSGSGGSGGFSGIYSIPLPGGASLGSHPYQVTAVFANALDLVPQSAVMVNDVAVGRVSRIYVPANSWYAHVTMVVNGGVHLPANAIAEVRQSSLLGEQYVALSAPPGAAPSGRLAAGATIQLDRTTSNTTVEQVLGALSLLLNDGGINQLNTITTQLNAALSGNEPQIRSTLTQINNFVSNLNAHRGDITAALDGLNALSATLSSRDQQIGYVLDNLTPGMKVFNQQRGQLVTMLNSLHTLTGVAVNTINKSRDQSVADLQALAPILRQLANAGQALPNSLQVLFTYPFTDQVLNDIKGDYLNIYLSVVATPGTCIYAPLTPGATVTATPTVLCPGQQAAGASGSPLLPLPSSGPAVKSTPAPSARGSSPSARPGSSSGTPSGTSSASPSSTSSGSPSPTPAGSRSPSPASSASPSPATSSSATPSTGGAG